MRGGVRPKSSGRSAIGTFAAIVVASALVAMTSAPAANALTPRNMQHPKPHEVFWDHRVGEPPRVPTTIPFVVADATTGAVIAERDAHKKLPPASTLKILTALALLPVLDPRKTVTATYGEATVMGTRVGLVAGATYRVSDLFYGMFLASGNDASLALSRAAGGDAKTVARMNDIARAIGASDTVAKTPDGLDTRGQVSSVHDLALMSMIGLQRPDFASYVAATWVKFPGRLPAKSGLHRETFEVWNLNRFMLENYPGAIGVKSGYTTKAHNTLVIAATRGRHTYIVSMLNAQVNPYVYATALMDWAFKYGARAHAVDTLLPTAQSGRSEQASRDRISVLQAALPQSGFGSGAGPASPRFPLPLVVLWGLGTLVAIGFLVRRRRRETSPMGDTQPA